MSIVKNVPVIASKVIASPFLFNVNTKSRDEIKSIYT